MNCPRCQHEVTRVGDLLVCPRHGIVTPRLEQSAAKRVFLSYGRDQFAELAERVKGGLEKEGHQVWFDADRLKPGVDWETELENALSWVEEARDGGALVLLMTRHSVRRPGGYCLNELARANEKGLTIIPVMVERTSPPLSICRIQWLDMTDCVPLSERFEIKLARLADALAQNRLDFEGSEALLFSRLRPLEFDVDIDRQLRRFTGRRWVYEEVEAWLKRANAPRIFLLTGEPGVGKTSISAWLCHRLNIAAVHLCKNGHDKKNNPKQCVLSIAYQLSTQLADYQKRLMDALSVRSVDLEASAQTLFDDLVVEPLYRTTRPNSETPVLILIDAVDEASKEGSNELADFIATEFQKTPEWLRLILTSRPEAEVLHPLQGCWRFDIDKAGPSNQDDIRAYLEIELKPFAPAGKVSDSTIETIASRSEGSFLYVECIKDELKRGQLSLHRLDEFPQGLAGHYRKFFRRQYGDLASEPSKRTFYETRFRPVFEIVTAACEPLEVDTMAQLFGWSRYEQNEMINSIGSLFPQRNGRMQPFHRSVVDWLTNDSRAGLYLVSPMEGHQRLADYGWQLFVNGRDELPDYFHHYFPQHLIVLKRWHQLERVLCDLAFFEQVCERGRRHEWMQYWQRVGGSCDPAGGYRSALDEFEKSAGDPLRVAHLARLIGTFLRDMGHYAAAMPFMERALKIQETTLKDNHPDLAPIIHDLAELYRVQRDYEKALPLYQRALQIRQEIFGPESPQVATSLHDLAEFFHDQEKRDQALSYYEEALRIREKVLKPDHPAIADSLNDLGTVFWEQGDADRALSLYQRALDIFQQALGPSHPDVGGSLHNKALVLESRGQYDEALPLFLRALAILEETYAPHHPDIQISRNSLAGLYETRGEYEKAVPLRLKALKAKELNLGTAHDEVERSRLSLIGTFEAGGDVQKTLALFNHVLSDEEVAANSDFDRLADVMNRLSVYDYNLGKVEDALVIARGNLAAQERYLGPAHASLCITLQNLAVFNEAIGDNDTARASQTRALRIMEAQYGRDHPDVMKAHNRLGWTLFTNGDYENAETVFRKNLEVNEAVYGADAPETAEALNAVVRCLQEKGDHVSALPLCSDALRIREAKLEPSHPEISTSLNNLGLSLVCLGELEEAEPHLLRAVEINAQTPFPHYWLAKLYQKRNALGDKAREVVAWRRYLDLGATSAERRAEAEQRLAVLVGSSPLVD